MADGCKIRENPALIPTYCDRIIAAAFDGAAISIALGTRIRLPLNESDTTMPPATIEPQFYGVLPPEAAIELHGKLTMLLTMMQKAKEKPAEN